MTLDRYRRPANAKGLSIGVALVLATGSLAPTPTLAAPTPQQIAQFCNANDQAIIAQMQADLGAYVAEVQAGKHPMDNVAVARYAMGVVQRLSPTCQQLMNAAGQTPEPPNGGCTQRQQQAAIKSNIARNYASPLANCHNFPP